MKRIILSTILLLSFTHVGFCAISPSINKDCFVIAEQWLGDGKVDINNGLVGYWSFDEGEGDTAFDESGNGNTGTINGAKYVNGVAGEALSFDGVDDYVDINYHSSIDFSGDATLSAWVKLGTFDTNGDRMIFIKTIDPDNWGVFIGLANNKPYVSVVIDLTQYYTYTNIDIEPDKWFHVVGVREGTEQKVFVNGRLYNSGTIPSGPLRTGASRSRIGRPQFDNGKCFHGLIDEVRINNRALSEAEIKHLYLSPSGSDYPADLNLDGIVNYKDYAILVDNWLRLCGFVESDFDGDGKADVLLRSSSTGEYSVATNVINGPGLPGAVGVGGDDDLWVVELGGDFDGYGTCDLLWRRESNNAYFVTLMENGEPGEYLYIGGSGDEDISVGGVGDFNGNGVSDLLWRRKSSNGYFVTLFDDGLPGEFVYVGGDGDADMSVVGIGDFDGDRSDDLLWRRSSNGATFVTLVNGGASGQLEYVGWGGDTDINVIGIGDFNGDGTEDVLSRRDSDGSVWVALIEDGAVVDHLYEGGSGDADLVFMEMGDFDGDRDMDLLWRRDSSGTLFVTLTEQGQAGELVYIGGSSLVEVAGVLDYDGDGADDILCRRVSDGRCYVILMDGVQAGFFPEIEGDQGSEIVELKY